MKQTGRKGLDVLLRNAARGKIDYIVTKSISRVSRDTLALLKIIRNLRERGINMHFENENLDSIRLDKEFEITLRSMLAQDESRNTSSLGQIKTFLETQGIKTATGKETWDTKTIQKMLKNEKYKGDTMLQKNYTEDFMTGKKVENTGQKTRYYIKDSHPAIVTPGVFDKVQEELAKRSRLVNKEDGTAVAAGSKYNGKYPLGNLLICGDCGASFRRRTERGKVVWRCGTRIEKGKEICANSPTLNDEWLKKVLIESVSENDSLDENDSIKNKVEKVYVFNSYVLICCKNGLQVKMYLE